MKIREILNNKNISFNERHDLILDGLTDCYRSDWTWTRNAINLMLSRFAKETNMSKRETSVLVDRLTERAWLRWNNENFRVKLMQVRELRNKIWDEEMRKW